MNPQLQARIDRLLELPKLIDSVGKRVVAQKAERRKLERRIALREAEFQLDLDADKYRNADHRKAALVVACGRDAELGEMYERMDQLNVAIDKYVQEREVLDHERKALKAALEREYAQILERVLTDAMLARGVAGGVRA